MSEIFISHSSRDNNHAIAIRNWLMLNNWNEIFLDFDEERGIIAGQRWKTALRLATGSCHVVIFIITKNWLKSDWSRTELIAAISIGKPLLAVVVEKVDLKDLPTELTAEYQIIDMTVQGHQSDIEIETSTGSKVITYAETGLQRLFKGLQLTGANADYFQWPPESDPKRLPYRGLEAFGSDDAGIYFGRAAEITAAISEIRKIREQKNPSHFVVLGASGSGKSSFVSAGILPRLARETDQFTILQPVRPDHDLRGNGASLAASIAIAFQKLGTNRSRGEISRRIAENGKDGILQCIDDLLQHNDGNYKGEPTLVMTIDQAETLYDSGQENSTFVLRDVISALIERYGHRVMVMFSIRSADFEKLQNDDVIKHRGFDTFALGRVPRGAYKEIIEGPARRYSESIASLTIGSELVSHLLTEIDGDGAKDTLPLLAYTMRRLFDDFGTSGEIALEDYNAIGGLTGSIEHAIEHVLVLADRDIRLPKDREAKMALLKRGLIPWTAGIDPVNGQPRCHVARLDDIPQEARPIVELLINERLLSTDRDSSSGMATVEPAHEAFLRCWTELNGWLQEDQPLLASLDVVRAQAIIWAANSRTVDRLSLRGDSLRDADKLLDNERFYKQLTKTEAEYIRECAAREYQENAQKKRSITIRLILASAAAVSLIVAGVLAYQWQQEKAVSSAAQTMQRARVAFESGDSHTAASEALSLLSGLYAIDARDLIVAAALRGANVTDVAAEPVEGQFRSNSISFSEAVYVGFDNAKIQRVDPLTLTRETIDTGVIALRDDATSNRVISLWSAGPDRLVVLHNDGSLHFIDPQRELPRTFKLAMEDVRISRIRVSPDGRTLAVSSADSIRIFQCAERGAQLVCSNFHLHLESNYQPLHWLVGDDGAIHDLRLTDGKLLHTKILLGDGDAVSSTTLSLPNSDSCNISDFNISTGAGVPPGTAFIGSKKCDTLYRFDVQGRVSALPVGEISVAHILDISNRFVAARCDDSAVCFYTLEDVSGRLPGTRIKVDLPDTYKRFKVSLLSGDLAIISIFDQTETRFFAVDLAAPVPLTAPMHNGSAPFASIIAKNSSVISYTPAHRITWNFDGTTLADRLKDSSIPQEYLAISIAELENGLITVLFGAEEGTSNKMLAVFDGAKQVASVPARSRDEIVLADGNDLIIVGDDETWFLAGSVSAQSGLLEMRPASLDDRLKAGIFARHGKPWGAVLSPDHQYLYVSHGKGSILEWSAADLHFSRVIVDGARLPGHPEGTRSLSVSSDGQFIATADNLGALVSVYPVNGDTIDGRRTFTLENYPTDGEVLRVAFSPEGDKLAILAVEGILEIFDWNNSFRERIYRAVLVDKHHDTANPVLDLKWINNEVTVVVVGDRSVRFFPIDFNQIVQSVWPLAK
ncbi:MAG: nSTAND1 domain-containing NTPase [Oceanococcus sp.]